MILIVHRDRPSKKCRARFFFELFPLFLFCWLFLFLLSLPRPVNADTPLRDDDGVAFTRPLPAQRIVTLAPNLTDMLIQLDARACIVGVGDDHDSRGAYKRSLTGFSVVSDAASINYEQLLALQPDLILAWGGGTPRAWIQQLRQLGLPVFVTQAVTLDDLAKQAELLGQLSGQQRAGQAQAAQIRATISALRERYRTGPRLRYFYQAWLQPLYSLSADHLLSQALSLCGADNIVAASPVAAPLINPEFVLQQNPDIILFSDGDSDASRRYWQHFPSLAAVRQQHLLPLDDRRLTRPGPEMLTAVQTVCAQIARWRADRATVSL